MPELDVDDIRDFPEIFSWYADPVSCSYHYDPSTANRFSLKIFIERNIICEAQCLYLFELVCKGEFFLLKICSENDIDADIAGRDKDTVIDYVVKKIIKKTTMGSHWEERHPDQAKKHSAEKDELRKILKDLIGSFIG